MFEISESDCHVVKLFLIMSAYYLHLYYFIGMHVRSLNINCLPDTPDLRHLGPVSEVSQSEVFQESGHLGPTGKIAC